MTRRSNIAFAVQQPFLDLKTGKNKLIKKELLVFFGKEQEHLSRMATVIPKTKIGVINIEINVFYL